MHNITTIRLNLAKRSSGYNRYHWPDLVRTHDVEFSQHVGIDFRPFARFTRTRLRVGNLEPHPPHHPPPDPPSGTQDLAFCGKAGTDLLTALDGPWSLQQGAGWALAGPIPIPLPPHEPAPIIF